jgi:hypothetical protein
LNSTFQPGDVWMTNEAVARMTPELREKVVGIWRDKFDRWLNERMCAAQGHVLVESMTASDLAAVGAYGACSRCNSFLRDEG